MSNIAWLFIFLAIGAPAFGLGVYLGWYISDDPSIPEGHDWCSACKNAKKRIASDFDHLNARHRASAPRGPLR